MQRRVYRPALVLAAGHRPTILARSFNVCVSVRDRGEQEKGLAGPWVREPTCVVNSRPRVAKIVSRSS